MKVGRSGDCRWQRLNNRLHCLTRNYDSDNFSTFTDVDTIRRIIRNKNVDYEEFRALIEPSIHGRVHSSFGGNDGDMAHMTSPNDPLFWVHHSFIDKIWSDHQKITSKIYEYGGSIRQSKVSLTNLISGTNLTIYDVMDIQNLCYDYIPFSKIRAIPGIGYSTPLKKNSTRLILPQPIPEEWLLAHGFNTTEVEKRETILKSIADDINEKVTAGKIIDPNFEKEDNLPLYAWSNDDGKILLSSLYFSMSIIILFLYLL